MMAMKTMTNLEIYNYASMLMSAFKEELTLPVKVNFYLQKNTNTMVEAGKEIEKTRMEIIQRYGTQSEDGQSFEVTAENIEAVNKELEDLFALEQEIKINEISLEAFANVELTTAQVAAIAFMIKEEE
jgi:hypothetical protein